jgi:DnaK suppressor protein
MKTFDIGLVSHFDKLLTLRERELCAVLSARDTADSELIGSSQGVTDFKDVAAEQSLAAVDEAQAEQAGYELEQVLAARRRLKDNTYGQCLDCGEAIDLGRLAAIPAAAYCAKCQAMRELPPHGTGRSEH